MNPIKKVPDKECGKHHISLLTYGDRSLSFSRKFYKNLKENLPNHKQKHNVSLKFWNEVNTKNWSILWLITNKNIGMIQKPVRTVKEKISTFNI